MTSKIEQIIGEIEEYIESCKYQPLSNTKIIVNKEQMEEMISELRMKTPEEIKRYQKIISNQEAILADAQARKESTLADARAKAEAIIAEAKVYTTELVSEHQIMQRAYAQADEIVQMANSQAQEIVDKATNDANEIRYAAIQYTDDMLRNLESMVNRAITSVSAKNESLLNSLQGFYSEVSANRAELYPETDQTAARAEAPATPEADLLK